LAELKANELGLIHASIVIESIIFKLVWLLGIAEELNPSKVRELLFSMQF
jgi:hypothetical protein